MEIAEESTSRVDSAVDVLSGKLKDILHKKKNWRIIFLKPDNQNFIDDNFPSRPVCSGK